MIVAGRSAACANSRTVGLPAAFVTIRPDSPEDEPSL
jgi:hypothetical protein